MRVIGEKESEGRRGNGEKRREGEEEGETGFQCRQSRIYIQ